jgi:thioredoxin 1
VPLLDNERKDEHMAKTVREIKASEFTVLINGQRPVFVDFYATWCGPCKAMEPLVERLAERFGGCVEFVKIDIDENSDIALAHGVQGVPTFVLFTGGLAVTRVIGATGEKALAELIGPRIGLAVGAPTAD